MYVRVCSVLGLILFWIVTEIGLITREKTQAIVEILGESIDKAQLQKLVIDSAKIVLSRFLNFMAKKVKVFSYFLYWYDDIWYSCHYTFNLFFIYTPSFQTIRCFDFYRYITFSLSFIEYNLSVFCVYFLY